LQPYTEDTLKSLAKSGVRKLTVVSPSFAVDCLETLEEVAIEYRDKFLQLGGERLTLVPALNDDDGHARVLAAIVKNQLQGWTAGAATVQPMRDPEWT
jgi:protoporphyrin/coproporphyrin ferrochelatase